MSDSKLRSFKKNLEILTTEKLKVSEKEKLTTSACQIYRDYGDVIVNNKNEGAINLYELSKIIFQASLQEIGENDVKFNKDKENRSSSSRAYKTKLYELSIDHLKKCSQNNIDNNTVEWVAFSIKVIQKPWIQADVNMENEISSCIQSCSSNSQLCWIQHGLMKRFWNVICTRLADRTLDTTLLCNYVKTAVTIMDNVDPSVLESSPFHVARTVIQSMKKATEGEKDKSFWSHSRKYAYASMFSYIVKRWGVEARDLIICESLDIIYHLASVINADKAQLSGTKEYVLSLVDDLLKLSIIQTNGKKVGSMSREIEQKMAELAEFCSSEVLKSAKSCYFNRANFELNPKIIEYVARWLIAEKHLSRNCSQLSDEMKGSSSEMYTLQGILSLGFGESIPMQVNRCNSWTACVRIMTNIIEKYEVEKKIVVESVVSFWKKRKMFATDALRSSFCRFLAVVISENLDFGTQEIPSVDAILKHALALMPNVACLPSSADLVENVLRYRSDCVTPETIQLICDTVSRTNPTSIDAIRLISAVVSYTEFNENSHFCTFSNEEQGSWTLRKDIVNWLLSSPNPMCHKLIVQLCQFHPQYSYSNTDNKENDDSLFNTLVKCNLLKKKKVNDFQHRFSSVEYPIGEMIDYVRDALNDSLDTEVSIETFIIAHEFLTSTKQSANFLNLNIFLKNVVAISESMGGNEFKNLVESISKWPRDFNIPTKHRTAEVLASYYISNMHQPVFDFLLMKGKQIEILDIILEKCLLNDETRRRCQRSMPFNEYVKKIIFEKIDDIYETFNLFKKYSLLLSTRHILASKNLIIRKLDEFLKEGDSIDESDAFLIQDMATSVCIMNTSSPFRMGGNDLDPFVVAKYPQNVNFDDRNVKLFLRKLKKSPLLSQNIVRYVLTNPSLGHLHILLLRMVLADERLLLICLATIPNMKRFFKFYQINFVMDAPTTSFLKVDPDTVQRCKDYVKKPKSNGDNINLDDLIVLLGLPKKRWSRVSFRFWKLFQQNPHLVCEKLHMFASESVELGLSIRLLELLKTIATSEFSRRSFVVEHVKAAFKMVYRSIFYMILEKTQSFEVIELCCDMDLRCDLLKYRNIDGMADKVKKYSAEISNFETSIAFRLERFLQNGLDSNTVDYSLFGYVEFYKQLDENLSEDVIKSAEAREMYIVDFLSNTWHLLPDMRIHIIPIVARFKNISSVWSRFPQPAHTVADENNFLFRARFNVAMKIMSNRKMLEMELSACLMLFLVTFHEKHVSKEFIEKLELKYKNSKLKRTAICLCCSELKRAIKCNEIENEMYRTVFSIATYFEEIAIFTLPFLFFVYVAFEEQYKQSVVTFLRIARKIDKDDSRLADCIAQCLDSVGINSLALTEKCNDATSPEFATCHFFKLAHLLLKHGYLSHSFVVANMIFDKLCFEKRNLMMIERTSLTDIRHNEEIIDLLAQIYVAENNSVALSSLPPSVQSRDDVRKVMYKKSKEWIKLISSNIIEEKDLIMTKWMCGLPSGRTSSENMFFDALLNFQFVEYPKIIDSSFKLIYMLLFHLGYVGNSSKTGGLNDKFEKIIQDMYTKNGELSIDNFRLVMLANGDLSIEPKSIEEQVIHVAYCMRETSRRRLVDRNAFLMDVNSKTTEIAKVAFTLSSNEAHKAASLILSKWKEECEMWPNGSVDVDMIDIYQAKIMCDAGDVRMAETKLRSMNIRFDSMSDVACAEYSLAISELTLKYRNNIDEAIRLLERGCKKLEKSRCKEAQLKLLLKFHSICCEQLSKLEEYRESRSFRMKVKAISSFEEQIKTASKSSRSNSMMEDAESKKAIHRIQREKQCEKDEVEKVEHDIATAARKAVSSAFTALSTIGDLEEEMDNDESIRIASLIIFPLIDVIYKHENNEAIQEKFRLYATKSFNSRLWLCATSHVASKCFSLERSPLKKLLTVVLGRLITDYPFHVLHTLFVYEFKSNGAEVRRFIDSVAKENRLKEIITDMRNAHSAYRDLARLDAKGSNVQVVRQGKKDFYKVPRELKLFKCKLKQLPIPIITQKVGKAGDYSTNGLITWNDWKETFVLADGLSVPKVWEVQGSDGVWYKTVWKKDDVRQDVLVEQMFDLTNNVLGKPILRTYNIVPIDTECGIIEFCGGTISLKELLCGSNRDGGLHRDTLPEEPSATVVSMKMRDCQKDSAENRRNVFVSICRSYSPVFRRFFYTNFPTTHVWRQRIEDYRQSLATWSVVCYIVGLGDRHASNVLFDQKMCTFVHIDLGMILEYSKRSLPVPEQVPFRLSRDLMDPILIEGVQDGQLAHICEETMEKLKQNGKVILGVASALLRETMTNFRETEMVAGRPSYISEMAIGRLRDKLSGTDYGVTAQSSDIQVRRLLREATSAGNLSRMFCGWMPFM